MGVQTTVFTFDGDASKPAAELRKLIKLQKELEKEFGQSARVATDAQGRVRVSLKETAGEQDKHKRRWEQIGRTAQSAGQTIITALGVGGVAGTLTRIIALQREWQEEIVRTQREQDKVGRQLQVQALLSDKAFQKILRARVAPAASQAGVSLTQGQLTATELVSRGFSVEEATGGALRELLLGARGTNFRGETPEFATAISAFLSSQGKQLNAANVRGVTGPLAALFQGTPFQAADLEAIAGVGNLLKEFGLQQDEIFAAITTLKQAGGLPASEAATKTRNVALILGAAESNKEVLDTLRAIGGEGFEKQVDLVGESFPQALQNLKDALDGLDQSSRQTALAKIFGRQNVAGAQALLANIETLQQFREVQRDPSVLARGVAIATSGAAATEQRLANQRELAVLSQGRRDLRNKEIIEATEAASIEAGERPFIRQSRLANLRFQATLGRDLEAGLRRAQGILPSEVQGRAFQLLEQGRQGATLPEIATGGFGPVEALTRQPAGGQRAVDFSAVGKTAQEVQLEQLTGELRELRLQLRQERLGAEAPTSPGGVKRTFGEQSAIELLERQLEVQQLQFDQLKFLAEKQQRRNPPAVNAQN